MTSTAVLAYVLAALKGHTTRSLLMLLAMGIGVAAVVVLTSLGEGARRYVVNEFASLGTNLLIVLPGRSETAGAMPGMFIGSTPRDLTIADAEALQRSSTIRRVAPLVVGAAYGSWRGREREVPVLGSTAELLDIRQWSMSRGQFLPPTDYEEARAVCVVGAKVRNELFGTEPALGEWLRLGDWRFRVIGVLETEGRSIGVDVEELVIIPVAAAQGLFDSPSLFRILVEATTRETIPRASDFIIRTIKDRHQGEEDITVVTQDAVLATFDRILRALTLAVAGIAAISLAVAGVLIMNLMLVAVTQRTAEIGVLKAVGASRRQILVLFLSEAALLSLAGAAVGLAIGQAGSWLLGRVYPALPTGAPAWAVAAALGTAIATGAVFGLLPARRAAQLDPVQALSRH